MSQQIIHICTWVLVQELAPRLGDVLIVNLKCACHKPPQPLIAYAFLKKSVSLVELRLQNSFLGVVQGVLQQPHDLPLVLCGCAPARLRQELYERLPSPAMASTSGSHVLQDGSNR